MSEITLETIGDKLRAKISEQHPRLLSEIDLDDDELEFLRANGDRLAACAICEIRTYDIQTAYLMMDIGMRNYHDGTYWEDFWIAVGRDGRCNINDQRPIGTFFIETMKRYNLAYRGPEDSKRYVNSIMVNAFIPEEQKYRNGFFDFIQKYFRLVLNSSIPNNLDNHLQVIANVFKNGNEKDYPEFANLQLIKSTRIALSDVNCFGHTVTKILRRLANDYDSAEDVHLGRYEKSFKEWVNDSSQPRSKHRNRIDEPPYIHYDVSNDSLYLMIPAHSLDENKRNSLEIRSASGEMLYSHNLHTTSQFGKKITDETSVPIRWNPLDGFTVWIGGKNCRSFVNQGFILLSSKGNSRNRISAGFNMIILPKGTALEIDSSELSNRGNHHIDGFMLGANGSVTISGHRYSVETALSPNLHIISPRIDAGCIDQDGNRYDLYSDHPLIGIDEIGARNNVKMYIGHGYKGIQIDPRINPSAYRDADHPEYKAVIDPKTEGLSYEKGIFHIRINGREQYRYVLIPGLKYTFEKEIYTADEASRMVCSAFEEPVAFDTVQGIVETPTIQIDGRDINLRMQVPSRRFSFDKKKWIMFGAELYYRNTGYTDLYIYSPTPVFPRIEVDFPRSKPQNLIMEGPYMTCGFDRIYMIPRMIEYSPEKTVAVLKFQCDGKMLFAIRYNADYKISKSGDRIVRSNPPKNTRALIKEIGTDREMEFEGDRIEVPDDFGDYDLVEIYDNGFRPLERKVETVVRKLHLPPDVANSVLSGVDFTELTYNHIRFVGKDFRNIVSYDREYDSHAQDDVDNRYEHQGESAYNAYLDVLSAIKDVFVTDKNIKRLRSRIMRFEDVDPAFTVRLCDQYLFVSSKSKMPNDSENSEIESIRESLQKRIDNLDRSDRHPVRNPYPARTP